MMNTKKQLKLNTEVNNMKENISVGTVIRTVCRKYFYSDMANKDTIADEIIKLPVDGNHQPDYLYMEQYMIGWINAVLFYVLIMKMKK